MEIILILTFITLIWLIFASFSDIKSREVPDWISYSLIIIGSVYYIIYSIYEEDASLLISPIIGFLICLGLGTLMYYSKQWGGGDAKLLMGLGIVLGEYPKSLLMFLSPNLIDLPLIVIFIINVLIVGALYGIFWSLYLALKNYTLFSKEFKKERSISRKYRIIAIVLSLTIILISFLIDTELRYLFASLGIIIFIMVYLSLLIKSVEKVCMFKKIPVEKLTEGDWIIGNIKINKSKIYIPKNTGVSLEDISLLKKYYGKSKLVSIKEGIPFIPSLLIAYIVTLVFGNLILILI